MVHVAYMRHGIRRRQYVNMNTDHDEIRCGLDGSCGLCQSPGAFFCENGQIHKSRRT